MPRTARSWRKAGTSLTGSARRWRKPAARWPMSSSSSSISAIFSDFPRYNAVRKLFFPDVPPVSTVVEVSAMMPSDEILIEVEATAYAPVTAVNARPDLAERRRETRELAILDAAIAEFAEKGLDGATTQAIADRAGITKTKLHYHIASKEELYAEVLEQVMATWAELFHGLDLTAGPEAFLAAYIRRKIAHALAHPAGGAAFRRRDHARRALSAHALGSLARGCGQGCRADPGLGLTRG